MVMGRSNADCESQNLTADDADLADLR